jgi:hypothetical protein
VSRRRCRTVVHLDRRHGSVGSGRAEPQP